MDLHSGVCGKYIINFGINRKKAQGPTTPDANATINHHVTDRKTKNKTRTNADKRHLEYPLANNTTHQKHRKHMDTRMGNAKSHEHNTRENKHGARYA